MTRRALSIVVSAVLAGATLVGLSAPAHADSPLTSIKINEVESNGGTPVDWIELTNIGATTTDVSGLILMDNQPRTFAIPPGTSIAPGGYYAIDVDVSGGFGLGAADSARVFMPDGTTLIDSYSWTAHAASTYGRCPNGTGAFGDTTSSKGLANTCPPAGLDAIKFNEVESNGDAVGDWAELTNISADPVDISGLKFKDGDDTHAFYSIPAGTTIAGHGYYALDEAAFGFGLGAADSVRLWKSDGTTSVDSYTWTEHAVTTYGRCPDGTGAFATTGAPTKAAANNCAPLVKINEIESDSGTPADWIELYNYGAASTDVSGLVVKDSNDAHSYVIPAGSTIAGGSYLVLDQSAFTFDLDANDAVRLFAANGSTLYDSYAWSTHATTSYGRCPNGTGAFATTQVVTKGAVNNCPGDLVTEPWPGGATVATADVNGQLGGDISGLVYEGTGSATPGVLWAVDNGAGALIRLLFNGTSWTTDTANGWSAAGKTLKYLDGQGTPDTEGLTLGGGTAAGGIYTATERNNAANGTSRIAILRYDASGSATTLTATNEWSLTADLPAVSPNLGIEDIAWVPDSYLVANGLKDESAGGAAYNPASYPDHGNGLFLVALESNGRVYAYALNHATNGYTRVASFASGFPSAMALNWEKEKQRLWVVCDDTCSGRSAVFEVEGGTFVGKHYYERPTSMPNLNNEGFTTTPRAECAAGVKPVFWSDDTNTGGNAIRTGTLTCTPRAEQTVAFTSTAPVSPTLGSTYSPTATGGASGNPVVLSVDPTPAGACTIASGVVTFAHAGTCVVKADQAGDDDYTAGSATPQSIAVGKGNQTVVFTSTKPASAVVGQTYPVTATGGASGNPVVISVTPTPAGACTFAGSTVTFKHPGTCAVNATQAGNDDYNAGSATAQSITITRSATATTAVVSATSVSATVVAVAPGAGVTGGQVKFTLDGALIGEASLLNGTASLDYVVPAGATRTVLATYQGNVDYAESAGSTVRRDPTISVDITPAAGPPNDLGWYDGAVTVTFTCTPHGSPLIGSCPAPVTLDGEGAGQVVEGVVRAQDGGRATASSGPIDIDLAAPTVAVGGFDNGATYTRKPKSTCVATDDVSGVASCAVTVTLVKLKNGKKTFEVVATAADNAGHTSTATARYKVKKPPKATHRS